MKKVTLPLICIFLALMLCSCSGVKRTPNEKTILSDYLSQNIDLSYANFDKIDILREQLNENEKRFIADIELTGKDDYAEYTCTASVEYNYYDDRGWMLDVANNSSWDYKCYKGRELKEIEEDIRKNYTSYLPGGLWVDDFKLEQPLEGNLQVATFDCEILTKHLITEYDDLRMIFRYDCGNWIIDKIEKTPINFKINLNGTQWETDDFNNRDVQIIEISEDSKKIVLKCNGIQYTGTLKDGYYEESTFFEHGPRYMLDKTIHLGSVWGVNQYADEVYIYDLTSVNDDVWLYFSNTKSWNGGAGAGYDLVSATPVPAVREY